MSFTLPFPLCESVLAVAIVTQVAPLLSGEAGCRTGWKEDCSRVFAPCAVVQKSGF